MTILILSLWILFVVGFIVTRATFPIAEDRKLRDIRKERTYDDDGYDQNGFTSLGYHRNGTRYDDDGYDVHGLDEKGAPRMTEEKSDVKARSNRQKNITVVMVCVAVILLGVTCLDIARNSTCLFGHVYTRYSCTQPLKCIKCGKLSGEAPGHQWMDATCTQPQTCAACRQKHGEPLGHTVQNGVCERCGKTVN